ncbi:MAG: hypothetical protein CM1200mP2_02740 [Planctomycetaceae bacterium]|nr:MAG: hypothetical protein CM1200mP2_02740 [Planctomycetaceae bacterium]
MILINQSTGTLKLEDEAGVERVEKDDLGRLPVRIDSSLYDQATGMWRVCAGVDAGVELHEIPKRCGSNRDGATGGIGDGAGGGWQLANRGSLHDPQPCPAVPGGHYSRGVPGVAVSVGGDQSRPVDSDEARKESVVLVALPNTSEGDLSFPVRMILAGRNFPGGKLPPGCT